MYVNILNALPSDHSIPHLETPNYSERILRKWNIDYFREQFKPVQGCKDVEYSQKMWNLLSVSIIFFFVRVELNCTTTARFVDLFFFLLISGMRSQKGLPYPFLVEHHKAIGTIKRHWTFIRNVESVSKAAWVGVSFITGYCNKNPN